MKRYFLYINLLLGAMLFSCAGQKQEVESELQQDMGTKIYTYNDTCKHLVLNLSLELPLGEDSVTMVVRDSLIACFVRSVESPGYNEDGQQIVPSYTGDKKDVQAMVNHYGKACYAELLKLAKDDYEERIQYLEEDTSMSLEDKKVIMDDVPQWAFELRVEKVRDTLGFIVYNAFEYTYCGGAHGGVGGAGYMTFDKTTGKMIKQFVKADATKALQPLIRKGLVAYYSEAGDPIKDKELDERLQIDGKIIPQPHDAPCPNATGDSLIFVYGQYEIACYADGMPAFMIAVKDLMPYLTPEGKALLVKEEEKKSK